MAYLAWPVEETLSREAMEAIAMAIDLHPLIDTYPGPVQAELINTRNTLRNILERTPEPEYKPPVCPTPQKRKYANDKHAAHDAKRWHMYPYPCECGYVHLSKQSPEAHSAKVNGPAADADEFPNLTLEDFLK